MNRMEAIFTKLSKWADCIPIVSTVTNSIEIAEKGVLELYHKILHDKSSDNKEVKINPIDDKRYISHIKNKSYSSMLLLLIPGVGNVIYHRRKEKREKQLSEDRYSFSDYSTRKDLLNNTKKNTEEIFKREHWDTSESREELSRALCDLEQFLGLGNEFSSSVIKSIDNGEVKSDVKEKVDDWIKENEKRIDSEGIEPSIRV